MHVLVGNGRQENITLKKGEIIGNFSPVVSVTRCGTNIKGQRQKEKDVEEDLTLALEEKVNHLETSVKQRALKFLNEEVAAFKKPAESSRVDMKVWHRINTGEAQPFKIPPRRLPIAKREEVDELLINMENEGVIEKSSSPWSSPVVLVKKKDGTTRFCVDYRRLNNVTKKDSYPLPRMDDVLSTLGDSQWFSTLDLKSGYWQVKVHPEDKEKTAFSTGSGLYHFNVMPFGLCNAPATFERLMEMVLKGLNWRICLVYLDDIMVLGRTLEEHLFNLKEVFRRMKEAGLQLNLKKCNFFQQETKFLGHLVTPDGIKTDPEKTTAVRNWPIPRNRQELRSFLGLCTYYRRFVRSFADIAQPLHRLTGKEHKFLWSEECQKAFEVLKEHLCKSPTLAFPRQEGMFIMDTDASNVGMGAVLSQLVNGQEVVIEYFSKVLTKPERNYCVTRRELLAIVRGIEHFHQYLYGRHFKVRTDHAALKWMLKLRNPDGQLARWIEKLQGYDFAIEHRSGKTHINADALSRKPCELDCKTCRQAQLGEELWVRRTGFVRDDEWSANELADEQQSDPDISPIYRWKQNNDTRPGWEEVSPTSPVTKALWAQWSSLFLQDGVLKREWESPDGRMKKEQIVVPRNKVAAILKDFHDGVSGGHLGVNKTVARLRGRFYWVNLRRDVENWIRQCITCGASKGPRTRSHGEMQQYNVGAPFERLGMDIVGPLPWSDDGNRYILVVMDYFSKWPEAFPIPNQEAETVAKILMDNVVCRFGVPLEIHSDQGRNFESEIMQKLCRLLGIHKTRTTALHPQSDGMVERFNRTLGQYLSKVIEENQRDWDKHIQLFLLAYRSAVHDSTNQTPASVVLGRELRLPSDILYGVPANQKIDLPGYIDNLQKGLTLIHNATRSSIRVASDRMKTRYDRRINTEGFTDGDKVWLYNPQRKKGRCPKLQAHWEGPYTVIKRINDVVYRIQRRAGNKMKVVHLDRLAPYYELPDRDDQD